MARDIPVKVTLENGLVCFDGVPEPMAGRMEDLVEGVNKVWRLKGSMFMANGFYYSLDKEGRIDFIDEYQIGRKNGLGLDVCEDGSLSNVHFYIDDQTLWTYRF